MTFCIGQLHPITVCRILECALLQVLSVIICSLYYILDRVLFDHEFHHDSCDYYCDYYGHYFHFALHVEDFCN